VRLRALVLAAGLMLAGCEPPTATTTTSGAAPAAAPAPFAWALPAWMPEPLVPADNPMSAEKVELGRHLFYDKRLSADATMSCASCHEQARAFTDGKALSRGVTGEPTARNSPSLANVAYLPILTWANPNLRALEPQALMPIFGTHPVEMGMAGREEELFARLAADARYPAMFRAAFPEHGGAIDLATITRALAAFQRALVSIDSPYDRYRYGGQPHAISAAAKRGEALFFSERLECYHCHGGVHLTDTIAHARLAWPEYGFHNTGLYNRDGRGGYPSDNIGIAEHTGDPQDMGRFRTPSLRNVALTAPYMHDGSIATLDAVIDHYAAGGRTIHAGPDRGRGSASPLRSPLIVGFRLTRDERADLVAFLESLTDRGFLTDPRFADPFAAEPPR
jgi:cytochrome c peroxidase